MHIAIAASTAACVAPALLIDHLGGMHRNAIFIFLSGLGAIAAAGGALFAVVKWCLRRRPFHGPAPSGSTFETLLAGLTGLCVGAYSGALHDVGSFHVSTMIGHLGLLPLALLVCFARRPAWRPFLDITILMIGAEIGTQVGMMLTKYKRWVWWDDTTGLDLALWAGGVLAATFWILVQRTGLSTEEILRVRRAVEEGEMLPPRKG